VPQKDPNKIKQKKQRSAMYRSFLLHILSAFLSSEPEKQESRLEVNAALPSLQAL
jgi:hypothetical protein